MSATEAGPEPRFRPGTKVRVSDRDHPGHCRTPMYLRGRTGTVVSMPGIYGNPEQLAYYRQADRQPLYIVRFRQADLWDRYQGASGDTVDADVYEHWLEPAEDAR